MVRAIRRALERILDSLPDPDAAAARARAVTEAAERMADDRILEACERRECRAFCERATTAARRLVEAEQAAERAGFRLPGSRRPAARV